MTIKLMCIGKTKEAYARQGIDDYRQRIRRYVSSIDYQELKAEKRRKNTPDAEIQRREYECIQKALTPQDCVIALDEHGVQYSSVEFADFISRCQMQGRSKTLTFVTGGATGFSRAFLQEADYVVSLSKMTFPHQLCRLVLLEQIYRAYTILAGEPYHKA